MNKDKQQKVTVDLGMAEAKGSWTTSTLTFTSWRNDIKRIAVIEIREPSDLRYIRERLDEIEAHWRAELNAVL